MTVRRSFTSEDARLAKAAAAKIAVGDRPTRVESEAYRRAEVLVRERHLEALVGGVPQGVYARWTGRQSKVLKEQESRYGVPCGRASIDVREVLRSFHDLLAKLSRGGAAAREVISKAVGSDVEALFSGGDSPAMERLRAAQAGMAELKLAQARGALVDRAAVRNELKQLAEGLQGPLKRLEREYGRGAYDVMARALDDFAAGVVKLHHEEHEGHEEGTKEKKPQSDAFASRIAGQRTRRKKD